MFFVEFDPTLNKDCLILSYLSTWYGSCALILCAKFSTDWMIVRQLWYVFRHERNGLWYHDRFVKLVSTLLAEPKTWIRRTLSEWQYNGFLVKHGPLWLRRILQWITKKPKFELIKESVPVAGSLSRIFCWKSTLFYPFEYMCVCVHTPQKSVFKGPNNDKPMTVMFTEAYMCYLIGLDDLIYCSQQHGLAGRLPEQSRVIVNKLPWDLILTIALYWQAEVS